MSSVFCGIITTLFTHNYLYHNTYYTATGTYVYIFIKLYFKFRYGSYIHKCIGFKDNYFWYFYSS